MSLFTEKLGTRRAHKRLSKTAVHLSLQTQQPKLVSPSASSVPGRERLRVVRCDSRPHNLPPQSETRARVVRLFGLVDYLAPTQSTGGNLQWKHQVAERMGLWATALRPRFVVGLGDNFYDVGVGERTIRLLWWLPKQVWWVTFGSASSPQIFTAVPSRGAATALSSTHKPEHLVCGLFTAVVLDRLERHSFRPSQWETASVVLGQVTQGKEQTSTNKVAGVHDVVGSRLCRTA